MSQLADARAGDESLGRGSFPPEVSVLLLEGASPADLATSLESLQDQSLAPDLFEVVLVHGPARSEGVTDLVSSVRPRNPSLTVRLVESTDAAMPGRQVGAWAARGSLLTVLVAGDRVSADFLTLLLESASAGVVAVAPGTTAPQGRPGLLERAGESFPGEDVPLVVTRSSGKLLPTHWAREARLDAPFWVALQARTRFRFGVLRTQEQTYLGAGGTGTYEDVVLPLVEEVAALRRLAADDPRSGAVASSIELAYAQVLNEHLRRAPEEHARLVGDVRRLVLQRFPWEVVNHGIARDLAISYCFPPYQDTSGNVAARRLRERGIVVDVVRADVSRLRKEDPASLLVPAEVVDQTRVVQGPASFGLWSTIARWVSRVERHVASLEREKGPYRSLYSRAMPVNSHLAAAIVAHHRPGLTWTAELSDPLKVHPNGQERVSEVVQDELFRELVDAVADAGFAVPEGVRLFELGEVVTYALADHIVFTNEHQREFMLDYCRDPRLVDRVRRISSVSHHPTLPKDFYTVVPTQDRDGLGLRDDAVDIAYFGVFYQTRGLDEVTAALEQLSPDVRRRVRLHVFTNRDDHLEIAKFASELADVVRLHPFVPSLEFLNLTTRFDVLLVNDAETRPYLGINPYLPSKLSDYRGSGTPVWAVAEPGSVLDGLATDYHSLLGDVDGATRALEQMVHDRFATEGR